MLRLCRGRSYTQVNRARVPTVSALRARGAIIVHSLLSHPSTHEGLRI